MGRQKRLDNNRTLRVIRSPGEIAAVIKEEMAGAGSGPLPELTVMTSSSTLIHQLRASSGGLSGVTFHSPLEVASLVFLAKGDHVGSLADCHIAPMIEALISSPLLENRLRYFKIDQLRTGAGYAEAIASTICELSRAGLTPQDLRKAAEADNPTAARLQDIAAIWEALESQSSSYDCATYSQVLDRASAILSEHPTLYAFRGRTVAFIDEQTPNILLKFLASVPRLTAVYFQAYPERKKLQNRIEYARRILDLARPAASPLRYAAPSHPPPSPPAKEIDILKARLFHPLGEDIRAASSGPDGTVHLEEHSGVEEELQSAVEWISRQVLEHRVPLERMAILLPEIDPCAFMLVERLASLPFDKSLSFAAPLPVYVASGIPARTQADGSRLLALFAALEDHLSAESLSQFIPYLRLSGKNEEEDKNKNNGSPKHLTFAESLELAYSCGTLGGLAGRPKAAGEWTAAIERRASAFKLAIEDQKRLTADDPEESRHARLLEDNERLLANFEAIGPAVTVLVKLHDLLVDNAPLDSLWDAVERFASSWVLLPPFENPVLPILKKEVEPLVLLSLSKDTPHTDPAQEFHMTGLAALRTIRKTLDSIRLPVGRFGEPRIYIGSLSSAVGLTFDAVRIMGLCEGAWPSRPPVDPILPDIDRRYLEPGYSQTPGRDRETDDEDQIIPRRDDRPLHQLCDFYRVVQGVGFRLALSFARQSADGTIKEPSSIYLEAATALRRPVSGKPASSIPSLKDLRLGYFAPAREAELAPPPLARFTVCREIAGRPAPQKALIPASWRTSASTPGAAPTSSSYSASTDMLRMRDLVFLDRSLIAGPQDGILPPDWPLPRLPGLAPHSPSSAYRVSNFLACPYSFLLENILHWEEPPSAPSTREIGQPDYGSLLHRVSEAFFSQHGKEFTARRRRDLPDWKNVALAIINREFDSFLGEYPLLSARIRDQQRQRLTRDFLRLLEHEWNNRKGLSFRAVEFQFGYPDPLSLDLGGRRRFFVHGYIDRLDEARGRILIRDIKSGKARPREKKETAPSPVLDAQLAVYALAMTAVHQKAPSEWPQVGGAAYFYPDPRGAAERTFEDDLDDLLDKGRIWLSTIADMIEGRAFPRTIDPDDCDYCPFDPICGDQAGGSAMERLQNAGALIQRFLALKGGEEEEPEEPDE